METEDEAVEREVLRECFSAWGIKGRLEGGKMVFERRESEDESKGMRRSKEDQKAGADALRGQVRGWRCIGEGFGDEMKDERVQVMEGRRRSNVPAGW